MPKAHPPRNVVKVGRWELYSALWGDARRNPPRARSIWGRLYALSLSLPLSRNARKRLQWFLDYNTRFHGNARKTCRYYGIPPKTFYYWKKRFDIANPRSLEDRSHRPKYGPLPVLHPEQTDRIFRLRAQYPYYSKLKLAVLYKRMYGSTISSWQIQRIIQQFRLYPDPMRARRIARNRQRAEKKIRIGKCPKKPWTGWLFSVDTICLHICGQKRYIFTAIDRHSRLLFTRAYHRHTSKSAMDFLEQLLDFAGNKIQNVHTDNGSEFHDHFEHAVKRFGMTHWWSRTHTPKDNAMNERVNRTLQEEFLPYYRECADLGAFNQGLLAWMTEYNHDRPHTSLNYKTPYEVACAAQNPLPVNHEERVPEGTR
jgi:transposase InsO family protein